MGFKISKTIDDFTSSTDLLLAKDRSGPLFVSRETDSMFILTAHLKGYKREHVKIEINEDGTRIAISGEKPVRELGMAGWKMYSKGIEMRGFKKVFQIPGGVILDKINARFNEEESVLTISMPKAVKGLRGGYVGVQEVIEEEAAEKLPSSSHEKKEDQKADSSTLESYDQVIGNVGPMRIAHDQVSKERRIEIPPSLVEDHVVEGDTADEIPRVERKPEEGEESGREEWTRGITEPEAAKSDHEIDKIGTPGPEKVTNMVQDFEGENKIEKRGNDIAEKEQERKDEEEKNGVEKKCEEVYRDEPPESEREKEKEKSVGDEATQGSQPPEKRSMICAPIIAGSALLVSIIVLVFHFIRNKNPPRQNQN